jgi:hypothetical protein
MARHGQYSSVSEILIPRAREVDIDHDQLQVMAPDYGTTEGISMP